MKYALLLLALLPVNALAEGKLTLRAPFVSSNNKYGPDLGLYVNEGLFGNFYYQSWTGTRINEWIGSNQDLMYRLSPNTSIGIGGSFQRGFNNNVIFSRGDEVRGNFILEQKLW